jgi:diguanylate cyclase (GGDEF)-like protein
MAGRPAFADVLAYQRGVGEFDGSDARMQDLVRIGGLLDQPHIYERERPNGRVLEVRSVPLAGGGVVRTYSDITARRAAEARIRFVARHDDLTRVANRAAFREVLQDAITLATGSGRRISVLYLDLDRFKLVNDTRGHLVGDALLALVADRIRALVRDVDTVARVGSDEFAIVQTQVEQPLHAASSLAQRLVDGLAAPYEIDGLRSVIGVSIGIAIFPGDGTTPDALLRNADTALYRAKADGRSTFRFFEPEMDLKRQQRSMLEQDLREAVALGHFNLAYQPVCDVATGSVIGFESLLRWTHAVRGVVEPKDFVPLAEDSGLIVQLGLWALETACAEAVTWPRESRIAVNLSPAQFRQPELHARVAEILARTGLPANRLDLEITEGLLLEHTDDVMETMNALKRQGIGMSLDDFGTANAGLSYLRLFPFDRVKIDRSFIQNIAEEPDTLAIVQAVLTLCRVLRLSVVAEGVETEQQLGILRDLGCPSVQGYYSGRPMSAAQVRDLLAGSARGWAQTSHLVGE